MQKNSKCFQNYVKCVTRRNWDVVQNLDCATTLAGCVLDVLGLVKKSAGAIAPVDEATIRSQFSETDKHNFQKVAERLRALQHLPEGEERARQETEIAAELDGYVNNIIGRVPQ